MTSNPKRNDLKRIQDSHLFALIREMDAGNLDEADVPLLVLLYRRNPERAKVIIERIRGGKEMGK